MDHKKIITLASTFLLAAGVLAACSSDDPEPAVSADAASGSDTPAPQDSASEPAAEGDLPIVGSDFPRSDTDFWNAYINYTESSAGDVGVEVKTTNSANDVAKLTSNVQTLLSQGVEGIVMAPQDTAAIAPTLESLEADGIPVVTIDTRPDTGSVFMVVRADNRAYGSKACQFLGAKLNGQGSVAMLQGDVASINGRDRTEAFSECMAEDFPDMKVFALPSNWDGALAASQLATAFQEDPNIRGVYMESSFGLAGTLQLLESKGLNVPPTDPKHVFVVSNDGIPEELKNIGEGLIDATVSQPADLYAEYGLYYLKAAINGETFEPGPTDHDSTIIEVRPGLLEDQLAAPLVTLDGAVIDGEQTLKFDDTSLWGNQ